MGSRKSVQGAVGIAVVLLITIEFLQKYNSTLTSTVMQPSSTRKSAIVEGDFEICTRNSHFLPGHSNQTTVAMCHRSLFGSVNLHHVKKWAVYNKRLGFDHIFIWYLPPIQNYSGFHDLVKLPFVTLQPSEGAGKPNGNWINIVEEHQNQRALILQCLRQEAREYDWVMFSDSDEFLWFNENIGVKDFLSRHEDFTYLSFGKMEYTMTHHVNTTMRSQSEFSLEKYAFTAGSFCHPPNKKLTGSPYCPANRGRSKVMVRPRYHNYMDIHGITKFPKRENGQIHFSTGHAHLKEWIGIFRSYNSTMREKADFLVQPTEGRTVSVHPLRLSFEPNPNGTYTMHFDEQLHAWFQFVSNRSIEC